MTIEESQAPFVIMETHDGAEIVLDKDLVKETEEEILSLYSIPKDRSEDFIAP